jgi:hypothetical protein
MSIECHHTQCAAHNQTEPFCDECECIFNAIKRTFKYADDETVWEYIRYCYPACSSLPVPEAMTETEMLEDFGSFLEK